MKFTTIRTLWLGLLLPFRDAFTKPGHRHFVVWTTALTLPTVHHSLVRAALLTGQAHCWRNLHAFANSSWDLSHLQRLLAQRIASLPESRRLFHGFHISAIDDTKVHRNSPDVWGTCTFHNYSARCPNRASTVRAHNWVVLGSLLAPREAMSPFVFVPQAAELYCREKQLPEGREFRTKDQQLLDLMRAQAKSIPGKHLAVFDGGYAHRGVVRGLACAEKEHPRIDFVTRLRCDACLYEPAPPACGRRGRPRLKGGELPKPADYDGHQQEQQTARVWLYGREREVKYKTLVCLWSVAGWQTPVRVVLAKVEGYSQTFMLVSSATELSALAILEIFCARFRQEDGFRDLKQEMGWEEGRYWKKDTVLNTTQMVLTSMALVRLLEEELLKQPERWWSAPPWYTKKERPSVRDVMELLGEHAGELRALLTSWLEEPS